MTNNGLSRRGFLSRVALAGGATLGAPVLLSGCGDEDSSGSGEGATVAVWDRAGSNATATEAFIEDWNQNEGAGLAITAEYQPQATEQYEDIVRTAFQTQRGPAIFHVPSSQAGAMASAGWIQPLDGLIDDETLDTVAPYLADTSELVWGGEIYAIPTTAFTMRLVINRGLFEKAGLDPDQPPTTFSEVEEAARAITAANGEAYGVALPTAWVGFLNWIVDVPILSTNADLTQTGLFNMRTAQFEAELYEPIIQHYRTLIQEEIAFPGAATLDADQTNGAFAEGRIGMYLSGGGIVGSIRNLNTKIDLGVGPIPVPDGMSQVQSPMNAGYPYAISSDIEDTESVAEVFKALVGPAKQQALAKGGVPPLSEEAWDSQDTMKDDWLQLFRPTDLDKQWPKNPGSVISVEGDDATTTITKLILDPNADSASALSDLSARYQNAYETAVEDEEIDPAEFTH